MRQAELFLGNAGTAFRPLTAALALAGGDYVLKGVARMHERPIGDLVDGLRQLGADVTYLGHAGYPPLHLKPAVIAPGGVVKVRGDVSSQFLTGLLMALPLTGETVAVERRRRADFQALHRDHAGDDGALRRRRRARRLAALHGTRRQPLCVAGYRLCRGRCLVGLLFPGARRHRRRAGARRGCRARFDPGRREVRRGAGADGRDDRDGPELDGSARAAGWPGRGRPRLQPHSRCGDDAGDDGAVRQRYDDAAQHRQLAGQGNRPHRGDGRPS